MPCYTRRVVFVVIRIISLYRFLTINGRIDSYFFCFKKNSVYGLQIVGQVP